MVRKNSCVIWENSKEGIYHNLKVIGQATTEDDKDKWCIAKTLHKLPKGVRKKVLEKVYFILIRARGHTLRANFVSNPNADLILLNFNRIKKSEKNDVIAHEIAHFMLGHHISKKNNPYTEKEADDLIQKWGFRRCY